MDVSKLITKPYLIIGRALLLVNILLYSCNNKTQTISYYNTNKIADFKEIDNNSKIFVFGAHFIKINGKTEYMTYLSSQDTIEILNLKNGKIFKKIKLATNASSICSKDSSVYVFYENSNKYQKIIISNIYSEGYKVYNLNLLPIFNENIFISTFSNTKIFIIDSTKILFPFRVKNETHNLIDTFSYLFLNEKNPETSYKLATYPEESRFDYLFKTISTFDYNKNNFIYTNQKSNKIHIVSLKNKSEEIFEIDKLENISFPEDKLRNISFIRKYIKQNDKVSNILVDNNSCIYIIVKFNETNNSKYRIYAYQTIDKTLIHIDIDFEIYSDMAYIENNKLIIPNEKSSNSVFFINRNVLQR
jgi:hypothetical protein